VSDRDGAVFVSAGLRATEVVSPVSSLCKEVEAETAISGPAMLSLIAGLSTTFWLGVLVVGAGLHLPQPNICWMESYDSDY
jgi:hypothetical protein